MRLAVFGAAGAIGRRVVEEAVARGHEVTAVHRRRPEDVRDGVHVVIGDVREASEVLGAGGHDVVVSAVGAGARGPDPDFAVYLDAARALVAALRELGPEAPRLIVVGGAGSLEVEPGVRVVDTPGFPPQFHEEALAQARALDYYRTVDDVRWTYVSPAALLEPGERTGRYRVGGDRLLTDDAGNSQISVEDYAVALVEQAERGAGTPGRIAVAY